MPPPYENEEPKETTFELVEPAEIMPEATYETEKESIDITQESIEVEEHSEEEMESKVLEAEPMEPPMECVKEVSPQEDIALAEVKLEDDAEAKEIPYEPIATEEQMFETPRDVAEVKQQPVDIDEDECQLVDVKPQTHEADEKIEPPKRGYV